MAFRRAKIKEQFDAAIPAVLEPGEQVQAETLSQSGPSPWLAGLIGWIVMLLAGTECDLEPMRNALGIEPAAIAEAYTR